MTESELMMLIQAQCDALGLYRYHVRDSRQASTRGWPDLVIIGARVLFRECKSDVGHVTPEQRKLGHLLTAAYQDWQVWRPWHWRHGVIQEQLAKIAQRYPGGKIRR
jgi:hypothetical protein